MLKRYNPAKHITRRLKLWWLLFNILVLSDELLKEGYIFKPSDIKMFGTHENLLIIGNIFFTLAYVYLKYRGDRT